MQNGSRVPLRTVAALFLRLGVTGFGGPAAHLALMHQELVEKRRWLSSQRYTELVGVTNLIPGPNSTEVAIHTGYLVGGIFGGVVAGVCFIAPSALIVAGLAAAYFAAGGFEVRADLFTGMQPVVIAAIGFAVWRLRSALEGPLLLAVAVASFALTLAFPGFEPAWLLAAAAAMLAKYAWGRREEERGLATVTVATAVLATAAVATGAGQLPPLAWVFLKTGALMFGGGYVLIPLLGPEVADRGWLTRREFLDGIALGQATPGPITTASTFVGYGVAGAGGAALATIAVYIPAFVAVLAGTAPFLRVFRERPAVRAAVAGVSAAAIGEIAAAAVRLGRTALASPLRVTLFGAAVLALAARVPVWAVLVASAGIALIAGALR